MHRHSWTIGWTARERRLLHNEVRNQNDGPKLDPIDSTFLGLPKDQANELIQGIGETLKQLNTIGQDAAADQQKVLDDLRVHLGTSNDKEGPGAGRGRGTDSPYPLATDKAEKSDPDPKAESDRAAEESVQRQLVDAIGPNRSLTLRLEGVRSFSTDIANRTDRLEKNLRYARQDLDQVTQALAKNGMTPEVALQRLNAILAQTGKTSAGDAQKFLHQKFLDANKEQRGKIFEEEGLSMLTVNQYSLEKLVRLQNEMPALEVQLQQCKAEQVALQRIEDREVKELQPKPTQRPTDADIVSSAMLRLWQSSPEKIEEFNKQARGELLEAVALLMLNNQQIQEGQEPRRDLLHDVARLRLPKGTDPVVINALTRLEKYASRWGRVDQQELTAIRTTLQGADGPVQEQGSPLKNALHAAYPETDGKRSERAELFIVAALNDAVKTSGEAITAVNVPWQIDGARSALARFEDVVASCDIRDPDVQKLLQAHRKLLESNAALAIKAQSVCDDVYTNIKDANRSNNIMIRKRENERPSIGRPFSGHLIEAADAEIAQRKRWSENLAPLEQEAELLTKVSQSPHVRIETANALRARIHDKGINLNNINDKLRASTAKYDRFDKDLRTIAKMLPGGRSGISLADAVADPENADKHLQRAVLHAGVDVVSKYAGKVLSPKFDGSIDSLARKATFTVAKGKVKGAAHDGVDALLPTDRDE